ncbi:MAG: VCBS repeat-containing protein [Candidatus Eisenbacteria bacterium]|nr:VCBS repeat-containing protein [Candidatus Eisenbacteria bacterium]
MKRAFLLASFLCAAMLGACNRPAPKPAEARADLGARGVLMLCQAQFVTDASGHPTPGPARMELVRATNGTWDRVVLEDTLSNVFHKAMVSISAGDTSVYTIGGDNAALTCWDAGRVPSRPRRLWQPSFGGKHNRVRDVERGDVDGDGEQELVMATHDQGVVAVADLVQGTWQITEVDSAPSTFVHEIEIGDVDRDGRLEFYATPSKPNKASGASQPGAVVQYSWDGQKYARAVVDSFLDTHAKEILVADLDGNGDELYVVKEAVTTAGGAEPEVPVTIVRYQRSKESWQKDVVSTIPDRQCRFLLASDLDGDGKKELVAASFKSGLWWVVPGGTLPWRRELIDAASSGFEHACVAADMDADGVQELYVASDDQKELRKYLRTPGGFARTTLLPLHGDVITWGLTASRM